MIKLFIKSKKISSKYLLQELKNHRNGLFKKSLILNVFYYSIDTLNDFKKSSLQNEDELLNNLNSKSGTIIKLLKKSYLNKLKPNSSKENLLSNFVGDYLILPLIDIYNELNQKELDPILIQLLNKILLNLSKMIHLSKNTIEFYKVYETFIRFFIDSIIQPYFQDKDKNKIIELIPTSLLSLKLILEISNSSLLKVDYLNSILNFCQDIVDGNRISDQDTKILSMMNIKVLVDRFT
jgi:hypothetical protein